MPEQPLVSMITYCYNGERFVSKYFDAVLTQTYPNIELIFFNNGSQDKTGEIAEYYRPLLEEKGIEVIIEHYAENQSTCMLKQKGFQMMHGEYFFGCDSDDLIDANYVEEMAGYLLSHPEKGIVYCQLRAVQEETGEMRGIMKMEPRFEERSAFLDILNGCNINFTAISYMMSRKHFKKINPTMSIYQSRYGENYQVQIPFLYNNLQGYVEKPLGQYTVRKDSYSGTLSIEKKVIALKGQEEAVLATLNQIGAKEYEGIFLKRIRSDRFFSSLQQNNKSLVGECWNELMECGGISYRAVIGYALYKVRLYKFLMTIRNGAKKSLTEWRGKTDE